LEKICNKTKLKIQPHPKRVATLPCKTYFFLKIAPIEVEQWQTKRTWTKTNVTIVDELVLSQ